MGSHRGDAQSAKGRKGGTKGGREWQGPHEPWLNKSHIREYRQGLPARRPTGQRAGLYGEQRAKVSSLRGRGQAPSNLHVLLPRGNN